MDIQIQTEQSILTYVPVRFFKQNKQYSQVLLQLHYYSNNQTPNYNNEFELPIFKQKEIPELKIIEISYQQPKQVHIDWQVAVMKNFQFKRLVIQSNKISDHFYRVFDLQPSIEELDILFNSYMNNLSDFLTMQDKIKNLKSLIVNITQQYTEDVKIKHIFPRFILENIDQLENLNLVIDAKGLFYILRQLSVFKEQSLDNMKEISLNFSTNSLNEQEQFIEKENKLNDDTFLQKFFKKFTGLTSLKFYFAQSLLRHEIYRSLCEVIQFQAEINQLQTLVVCISQSRVLFDLLEIFESVQKLTNLKKFELNLKFSTKVTFTQPKEVFALSSIEDLNLNLTYCPCSNKIMEYVELKNLIKLKVNLSYITSQENQTQNVYFLSKWIKENTQLQSIDIDLLSSAIIEEEYYLQLIQELLNKSNTLKNLYLFGLQPILMTEKTLEIVKSIQSCFIYFQNRPMIEITDRTLRIGFYFQREYSIDIKILSAILEYTRSYINQFHLSSNIDFGHEILDNAQQAQKIINLLLPFKQLRHLTLRHQKNIKLTKETMNDLIILMGELPQLTNFEVYILEIDAYKITKEHLQMISNIISKNFQLKSIVFNEQYYFKEIINQRYKLLQRLFKSLKYITSDLKYKFRSDIINEIIEYAYKSNDKVN